MLQDGMAVGGEAGEVEARGPSSIEEGLGAGSGLSL